MNDGLGGKNSKIIQIKKRIRRDNKLKRIFCYLFFCSHFLFLMLCVCLFLASCGGYKQGSFPVPIFFIM